MHIGDAKWHIGFAIVCIKHHSILLEDLMGHNETVMLFHLLPTKLFNLYGTLKSSYH